MKSDPAELLLRPEPISFLPKGLAWAWADSRLVWILAIIPYAIAIIGSARAIATGHRPGNLIDFLGAARQMLNGRDIYLSGTYGYVYPPLIAFLYQPLAMIPENTAAFISLFFNAAVSLFTLQMVSRTLLERLTGKTDPLSVARVAMFAAFCAADKIKGELFHLETNVFMLLAFSMAMRWVDRRPSLCGLALGFAFNIKYLPLVLVPYRIIRKRWSAVGWFAVWAIVIALLPALSMGWTANLQAWAQAGGGLFRLFGLDLGVHRAAFLRSIDDSVSTTPVTKNFT